MKMRHKTFAGSGELNDLVRNQVRLNRRNAVTCNTLHLVECANQLGKSFVRALPEIADIYSGQYDLFPAFACYLFGLRDKVGELAIPAASARRRNRAKRAEIVASVLYFQKMTRAVTGRT